MQVIVEIQTKGVKLAHRLHQGRCHNFLWYPERRDHSCWISSPSKSLRLGGCYICGIDNSFTPEYIWLWRECPEMGEINVLHKGLAGLLKYAEGTHPSSPGAVIWINEQGSKPPRLPHSQHNRVPVIQRRVLTSGGWRAHSDTRAL